jgi:hypothetical protein
VDAADIGKAQAKARPRRSRPRVAKTRLNQPIATGRGAATAGALTMGGDGAAMPS